MSADKKLTNRHLFKTQCECYVITLKGIIFIFSLPKTKRSVIFANSQNKRKQTTSISELSKDFSADIEVIAASKDRQLDDFPDFTDLSAGSLNRPQLNKTIYV